jgi:hypothetical protein
VHFPWPYTVEEIAGLGEMLPPPAKESALTLIVDASRRFLAARRLKARDTHKPAAGRELGNLSRLVGELISALEDLSAPAMAHLERTANSWERKEASFADLLLAAYTFRDSNPGLSATIEEETRGRSAEGLRDWLLLTLDEIFATAHKPSRRPRGRPRFIRACVAPLAIPHVGDDAIEKALSNAKSRRNKRH